jgi:hypothetical protein
MTIKVMENEPTKCVLQLYINTELKKLAKGSGMNLSQEFEEWIRIRLNQSQKEEESIDIPMEIAKRKEEILRLEQREKIKETEISEEQQKDTLIDKVSDTFLHWKERKDRGEFQSKTIKWNNELDTSIRQLQFVFKKRLDIILNSLIAKDLILNKLKEKGFDTDVFSK